MSGVIGGAGSKSGVIGETELEYEYGTWTGTFTDNTNDMSMDNNTGTYVRIGNSVTVCGYFVGNSLGSCSGNMYLKGLPFNSNVIGAAAISYGSYLTISAGYTIAIRIPVGQPYLILDLWDAAGGTTQLQSGELTYNGRVQITATYTIS